MRFFLEDDTSARVDQIIKRLNKLMDGDVSSQMKGHGIEYRLNYGASVLWLRNLAKEYAYSNELANRLWHREIRETMILASLIAEDGEGISEMLKDWSVALHQKEIAEQLGANLLWRLKDLFKLSQEWLNGDNENMKAACWVGLSVFVQKNGDIEEERVDLYLKLLEGGLEKPDRFMLRVQGRFLRQLCRRSKVFLEKVEKFISQLNDHPGCAWLVEDVKTEIEFVKGSGL